MTLDAFYEWLRSARRGRSTVYYEGYIALDRWLQGQTEKGLLYYRSNADVSRVAQAAWEAYRQGFVELTQRKLDDGVYAYLATRTSRRLRTTFDRVGLGLPLVAPGPVAVQLKTGGYRLVPFQPPRM